MREVERQVKGDLVLIKIFGHVVPRLIGGEHLIDGVELPCVDVRVPAQTQRYLVVEPVDALQIVADLLEDLVFLARVGNVVALAELLEFLIGAVGRLP